METIIDLARVALALSDPIRLQILDLLVAGRDETCCSPVYTELPTAICPSDLLRKLGIVTASKLSYHLSELQQAALIQEQRQGKRIYYTPNLDTLSLFIEDCQQRYLAGVL
jgi:ArsR family transcriptional regulator, arsenate/arsenite/antimonite-responsive transcriptional repressor